MGKSIDVCTCSSWQKTGNGLGTWWFRLSKIPKMRTQLYFQHKTVSSDCAPESGINHRYEWCEFQVIDPTVALIYHSYQRCGFKVIDPTVALILSPIGPPIRGGHIVVSHCTTVVVLILAVAVSLQNCMQPLICCVWAIKKPILLYW